MDKIISALSNDSDVRIYIMDSTKTVETANEIFKTSPLSIATLGRVLTATALMGSMLKNDNDAITVQIKSDGIINSVLATSKNDGTVKGYVSNNNASLPLKPNGKLDVSGAVGKGILSVIRDDFVTNAPYIGKIDLVSGEIAEDITYYYAKSEQIPTACALGVLVDKDLSIKCAGGFIVQLLPGASEKNITKLEKNIGEISSMTDLMQKMPIEKIIDIVLKDIPYNIIEEKNASYHCSCSKEKCEKVLISLGREELEKLLNEDKKVNMECSFCDKNYNFDENELKAILKKL